MVNRFVRFESLLLAVFFLFPFIYLLTKFNMISAIEFSDVRSALQLSTYQSFAASIICVVLALPAAVSLNSLSAGHRKLLKIFLMLPQALPIIFTVLIAFTILNPFPMGSSGVIILFCVVNFGLTVVVLEQAIRFKIGRLAFVSETYGISRLHFLNKVFIPILSKDLLRCFYLVFVFCFTSFSIPLIAGGGRSINFEMLIYEKIYIQTDWDGAVGLAAVQTAIVFLLAISPFKNRHDSVGGELLKSKYLSSKTGLALLFCYIVLYFSGYLLGVAKSVTYLDFVSAHSGEILQAILGSLVFSFFVSMLSLILIYLIVRSYIKSESLPFILNYLNPSTVVIGFSFYLLFSTQTQFESLKFLLAFSVLAFPALFKLLLSSSLQQLNRQIRTAKLFSIPVDSILFKIILPQIKKPLGVFLSVQSLWVLGDYSISRAIGLQKSTLGLLSESFLSGYRLQAAYIISLLILLVWIALSAIIYFLIKDKNVEAS